MALSLHSSNIDIVLSVHLYTLIDCMVCMAVNDWHRSAPSPMTGKTSPPGAVTGTGSEDWDRFFKVLELVVTGSGTLLTRARSWWSLVLWVQSTTVP
jgi:hypothetical protein